MKYIDNIQALVVAELGEYAGVDTKIHFKSSEGGKEYYIVDVMSCGKTKQIYLRASANDTLEVRMGEDTWVSTVDYNWTIKYFWIALLGWKDLGYGS